MSSAVQIVECNLRSYAAVEMISVASTLCSDQCCCNTELFAVAVAVLSWCLELTTQRKVGFEYFIVSGSLRAKHLRGLGCRRLLSASHVVTANQVVKQWSKNKCTID